MSIWKSSATDGIAVAVHSSHFYVGFAISSWLAAGLVWCLFWFCFVLL